MVDRPMLRDRGTTGPFSWLVSATQRMIESLSGGLLRWGKRRSGWKEGRMMGWLECLGSLAWSLLCFMAFYSYVIFFCNVT